MNSTLNILSSKMPHTHKCGILIQKHQIYKKTLIPKMWCCVSRFASRFASRGHQIHDGLIFTKNNTVVFSLFRQRVLDGFSFSCDATCNHGISPAVLLQDDLWNRSMWIRYNAAVGGKRNDQQSQHWPHWENSCSSNPGLYSWYFVFHFVHFCVFY